MKHGNGFTPARCTTVCTPTRLHVAILHARLRRPVACKPAPLIDEFIVADDGSVDIGVAQFVKWALHVVAVTSIFQSTHDTVLATGLLVSLLDLTFLSLLISGLQFKMSYSVERLKMCARNEPVVFKLSYSVVEIDDVRKEWTCCVQEYI